MDLMAPPPFSVKTLAERWGCSRQHVYDMIKSRDLKAFYLGDRTKGCKLARIAAEEVARWEASMNAPRTDLESSTDASSSPGSSAANAAAFASVRGSRSLKLVQS